MAYTTIDAINTLNEYLNITEDDKQIIEGTKNRGFVLVLESGESIVVFVYPLVHKQDNTKTYFDSRDSGAKERKAAWEYALVHRLQYFCLGVNSEVDKYVDYVFSLECDERAIEILSGTKDGERNGPGNQIIIPNDFWPQNDYERIQNRLGIYISAIHRSFLREYLRTFDNRPYLGKYNNDVLNTASKQTLEDFLTLCFNTKLENSMPRNRILFGAPGTGKSFILNQDREKLLGKENEMDFERVTFHPDYSYANFVGTYKPVPDKDSEGKDAITYRFVPGPFLRVYVKALKNGRSDSPRPFLLIIEEINRANVASVFGDVFQLLDRDDDNVSEYPIQATEDIKKYLADELGGVQDSYAKIRIPNNMFIWATMNSADQGVFPMDTAFKRRWDFTYLGIDEREKDLVGKTVVLGKGQTAQKVEWNKLRKAINRFLANQKINEDKQLGPYFISRSIVVPKEGDEIDREKFIDTFKNKVIMYLFEDAAKQKRPELFEGCFANSSRYSEICKEFDEKGIGIFFHEIQTDADPEDLNVPLADDGE